MEATLSRIRALVSERPELAERLARLAKGSHERLLGPEPSPSEFLEMYVGEARHFLELCRRFLKPGVRVLEIGGGLGLFHLLARDAGADIVSIEPSGTGFSLFRDFALKLLAAFGADTERFVDASGSRLPWPENRFELVASNNVLEHVEDPERVIKEMYRVLADGGATFNNCPNYLVPYEPHFRVPVIPCAVNISGRLLWRTYGATPLWSSLNSISALTIYRVSRSLPGARLRFHDAVGPLLERLRGDDEIARRHGRLARIFSSRFVRKALQIVPPLLFSPMVFEISKAGGESRPLFFDQ